MESTGKSQLAYDLARLYNAEYTVEYAREWIEENGLPKYKFQLDQIAKNQYNIWKKIAHNEKRTPLFFDTDFINFKIWYEHFGWKCPDFIEQNLENCFFDHILLTATDVPWVADGIRQNEKEREVLHQTFLKWLYHYKIPFSIVEGIGENRLKNAQKALKSILYS